MTERLLPWLFAALDHVREGGAHAEERTLEVDVEDLLPFLVRQIDHRHHALDGGGQHQHPDRSQASRLRDHRVDVGRPRDVARDRDRVAPLGDDGVGDDLRGGPVDVGDHDVGTLGGEAVRDLLAEARRATGDDGDAVAEEAHR